MRTFINRAAKIAFLKNLQAGRASLTELMQPRFIVLKSSDRTPGVYVNTATGQRYSEAEALQLEANRPPNTVIWLEVLTYGRQDATA